jgi:hypothetical protein
MVNSVGLSSSAEKIRGWRTHLNSVEDWIISQSNNTLLYSHGNIVRKKLEFLPVKFITETRFFQQRKPGF